MKIINPLAARSRQNVVYEILTDPANFQGHTFLVSLQKSICVCSSNQYTCYQYKPYRFQANYILFLF